MNYVERVQEERIREDLGYYPIVALLGPRQVGKTTLSRRIRASWDGPTHHFDLEDVQDQARLADLPLALDSLTGLVVIDEAQLRPDLFSYLRVLADRDPLPARFLLLGSASPTIVEGVSQSLAGRVSMVDLSPLSLSEVGAADVDRLWLRGGFPRSLLAPSDAASARWRSNFVDTFLRRDLPDLGVRTPAVTMKRLWTMLAHQHGQILGVAPLARAFDLKQSTVSRYVDLLVGTYVLRRLQPWHANLNKRQVKRPKVYIADSGLLHALLHLSTLDELRAHPVVGASWEGFALSQVLSHLRADPSSCWFWATHSGAELDLLITRGGRRRGFEFKLSSTPKLTKSMAIACRDLELDSLDVIHAGRHTFALNERVRAVSVHRLLEDVDPS